MSTQDIYLSSRLMLLMQKVERRRSNCQLSALQLRLGLVMAVKRIATSWQPIRALFMLRRHQKCRAMRHGRSEILQGPMSRHPWQIPHPELICRIM